MSKPETQPETTKDVPYLLVHGRWFVPQDFYKALASRAEAAEKERDALKKTDADRLVQLKQWQETLREKDAEIEKLRKLIESFRLLPGKLSADDEAWARREMPEMFEIHQANVIPDATGKMRLAPWAAGVGSQPHQQVASTKATDIRRVEDQPKPIDPLTHVIGGRDAPHTSNIPAPDPKAETVVHYGYKGCAIYACGMQEDSRDKMTTNEVEVTCKVCISRGGLARMKPEPVMGDGVSLIGAERNRQLDVEEWNKEHDDSHDEGELAMAAVCYATPPELRRTFINGTLMKPKWPWEREAWKPTPTDRIRELVKAGALIAAEIDRLHRLAPPPPPSITVKQAMEDILLSVGRELKNGTYGTMGKARLSAYRAAKGAGKNE